MISKEELRKDIREILFAYGRDLSRGILFSKIILYISENHTDRYDFLTVSDLLDEELFIY